jgi:hypothetical protein
MFRSVCLEIVLLLMQDWCMFCVERIVGSKIVLETLDGTPRGRESCGISFRSVLDSARIGAK